MKNKILRLVVILLCIIALYYLVTTLARSLASSEGAGLAPSGTSEVAALVHIGRGEVHFAHVRVSGPARCVATLAC
jgi:hypothetical protein